MSGETLYPRLDPGSLRHRVTLLSPSTAIGPGGAATTYAADNPPITARAAIEDVQSAEKFTAGQDVSVTVLKVTMWYRPQFTAGKRIQTDSGAVYIIQAVENVREMNVSAVLTCLGIGPANG